MRFTQMYVFLFMVFLFTGVTTGELQGTQQEDLFTENYKKAFTSSYRLASSGKYDEAMIPLLTLHRQNPNDYTVALRLGYLNNLKRDFDKSIQFYRRAINIKRNAVEPLLGVITPLINKSDYREVLIVGEAALKLDPGNFTCLSKMAYSYYMMGDFDNAARFYRKILELHPSDIKMRNGLAWSYLEAGKRRMAKQEFNKVLLLSPYNQSALFGSNKAQ